MTLVQAFIAQEGGPSKVDFALGNIEHFFNKHPRAALRLCCVGLSGGQDQDSPSWAPMDNLVRELFEGDPSDSIVDKNKIKRFADNLNNQRKPKNLHDIGLLVSHMLSMTPNLKKEPAVAEGLTVFDFPTALERYLFDQGRQMPRRNRQEARKRERAKSGSLPASPNTERSGCLGRRTKGSESLGRQFFRQHGRVVDEESYYACYRFSMTKAEVVKTFLTFRSPTKEIDRFTFRHIYQFETDADLQ